MKTLPKILLELILALCLIVNSFQKSTLALKNIQNQYCDTELNRFSFSIYCELRGDLSQSMFRNITIKLDYYYGPDPQPEIQCEIPEISNGMDNNMNLLISCYINNYPNNGYPIRFEGESNELDIVTYNELYLDINCQKTLTLVFGDIIEQECQHYDSNSKYRYKITLLNEIIPKDLGYTYWSLQPKVIQNSEDSEKYIYNNCNLNNIDYNNHFICTIEIWKKLEATIYYEKDFIYENWINDYKIIVKNQNKDLYIGYNILCIHETKINLLNILKGNCKNGVFFFSVDFSSFADNVHNENLEIFSKELYEFKRKVDSKIFKNYCYLDNRNEEDKYDILK